MVICVCYNWKLKQVRDVLQEMSAKSQRLQQSQLVYVTHSFSRVYIYRNLHILCVQHEGFVSVGNNFGDCYTQTFIT